MTFPTPDDLLELWADTPAPVEPKPTLHPSMLPAAPRTIRIVGSVWSARERRNGRWDFLAGDDVIWSDMTGSVDDVFRLLMQVHRDPSPRAETPGAEAGDQERSARPLVVGLIIATAAFWTAVAWAALRWRGVL